MPHDPPVPYNETLGSAAHYSDEEIQNHIKEHGKPKGLRLGANIRWLNSETTDFIDGAELFEVGLNDKKFTPEDAKQLLDRGINIFSNLGDYPEWWQTVCELKLMAFKTNYAEAYTEWWHKNR